MSSETLRTNDPPWRRLLELASAVWHRIAGGFMNARTLLEERGPSGQMVDNYELYVEGDVDPYLRKTIQTLVVKEKTFIVYLDQDCLVEWAYTTEYGNLSPIAAGILNGVSDLEATCLDGIPKGNKIAFHRMLGEAVARVLEDKDGRNEKSAQDALDKAAKYIKAIRESVARTWNLESTLAAAIFFVASASAVWWWRDTVRSVFGTTVLELALMSAAGVVGGFLSYAYRSRQIELDASGGRGRYYFNGIARSRGAAAGAVFVGLAIKTKLVFGFLSPGEGSQLSGLLLAGMLAGVSERLVPSLAADIEGKRAEKDLVGPQGGGHGTPYATG